MVVLITSEDGELIAKAEECPRCSKIAFGDRDALSIPLAMPINTNHTVHLCWACLLIFGTN